MADFIYVDALLSELNQAGADLEALNKLHSIISELSAARAEIDDLTEALADLRERLATESEKVSAAQEETETARTEVEAWQKRWNGLLTERDIARAEAAQSKSLADTAVRQGLQDRRDLNAARDEVDDLNQALADLREQFDTVSALVGGAQEQRDAARAEVAYLRRQMSLEENFRDPEFGGCVPDPDRPAHLKGET